MNGPTIEAMQSRADAAWMRYKTIKGEHEKIIEDARNEWFKLECQAADARKHLAHQAEIDAAVARRLSELQGK